MCDSGFFFSSRRRHTRYWRDWSSDVCSSDLTFRAMRPARPPSTALVGAVVLASVVLTAFHFTDNYEIGRASCRGKSVDLGGRRIIKKKKESYISRMAKINHIANDMNTHLLYF